MASNLEYIKDGKTEYCFAGNFEMLERLESKGYDLAAIFNELSSGLMHLSTISDVLSSSMHTKNDAKVLETDKADLVKSIIDRYGLQEAAMIARLMLSYAMVGSIKKHQLDRGEMLSGLMSQITDSKSMSLKRRGLVWTALCTFFIVQVCLIFNALNQYF